MSRGNNIRAISYYIVDAFADKVFGGNPACVCVMEEPLSESEMLSIASEMNLSETAFVVRPQNGGGSGPLSLRWFTPVTEVPLCGHATMAASKVLFDELGYPGPQISFATKSGILEIRSSDSGISMDFPADTPEKVEPPAELLDALGIEGYSNAIFGRLTGKLVLQLWREKDIRDIRPDFEAMKKAGSGLPLKGVGVTAGGTGEYDFISRYFNPWAGVNEDPVTGSVHTLLGPYWGELLGKKELRAFQASKRGGSMLIKLLGSGRLELAGRAVVTARGELYL